MSETSDRALARSLAIVGMSGRFPGSEDLEQFWRHLKNGVELISFYSRRELEEAGVDPDFLADRRYVPAGGRLRDIDLFDANFFDVSPRDAEIMDPQQRIFLECCWHALENAGLDSETFDGAVGVFAGAGSSSYLFHNLLGHRDLLATVGPVRLHLYNKSDFLTSLVAFKLGLTGPSITVQSACSTSLVAVGLACQSLLSYQCDAALAGGVRVLVPEKSGYIATDSVMSPDGHCRAFAADAQGTVPGSGGGVVVLRRLADALEDGDRVLAVIRGFATNNDGSFKSSYMAPSIDGQMEVVALAQAMAEVAPETISYVETHGTGTPLGDPIEIAALVEAFAADSEGQRSTTEIQPSMAKTCGLGSVKTNIGHLDAAAGVAGLIKTVLAMEHEYLPPSLNFAAPNPQIDLASSPFYVVREGQEWPSRGAPRRAGISAFGLGGVNAHVVLEEAPWDSSRNISPASRQILVLSAATETALEQVTQRFAQHLRDNPELPWSDAAHTAQIGRRALSHRRILVGRDRSEALQILENRDARRLWQAQGEMREAPIAFLFPGLGNHYPGMAAGLYREMPGFRARVDQCAEILLPRLGVDLRLELFEVDDESDEEAGLDLRRMLGHAATGTAAGTSNSEFGRTKLSQPAVFVVEYALAGVLDDLGIRPQAMLGFSIGEFVAACLAEVLSLEDALYLVAERAKLIETLPPGGMLAVPLPESEARSLCQSKTDLSMAAVCGPELCVVAGPEDTIAALETRWTAAGQAHRRLETRHAFHSSMMEEAVDQFRGLIAAVTLEAPTTAYLSSVTGTWITAEQATDPDYWARHLCGTVRFSDAVAELWRQPGRVLMEVGPGQTLSSWALQHPDAGRLSAPVALPTLRHAFERKNDLGLLLESLGRLWLAGQPLEWKALWQGRRPRRVSLPTYPFERQRYWIDPVAVASPQEAPLTESTSPSPMTPEAASTTNAKSGNGYPRPSLQVPFVAPRNPTETRLAGMVRSILSLERVGILDSFFDLGGDSLQATTLLGRIRQGFGRDLSLRTMFESPAIVDLAPVLVQPSRTTGESEAEALLEPVLEPMPPLEPVPRPDGTAPLSLAQQRLWFIQQLEPESLAYNQPLVLRMEGLFDAALLDAALTEIVRRHEILRTTFRAAEDGEPVQVIHDAPLLTFPRVDLRQIEASKRKTEFELLVRAQARRPFDLAQGSLMRPSLFRLENTQQVVVLVLHHIISDGWSMSVLARELEALCNAAAGGQSSPLAELGVQYADYAHWQRKWLTDAKLESQLEYWRARLAGASSLQLPTDRPRTEGPGAEGLRLNLGFSRPLTRALQDLSRRRDATLFTTLLATFQLLLHRTSNQADLCVGSPVASRRHPQSEGLIGFFVGTLVLRSRLRPESSFDQYLTDARETILGAQAHQDVPFERLVEELQPERDLLRTPLFQVMLAWQSVTPPIPRLPGAEVRLLKMWQEIAPFDITLSPVVDDDGCLRGYMEWDRRLFDKTTAQRMLGHFGRLLTDIAERPNQRCTNLTMLGSAEIQQLLTEPLDSQVGQAVPADSMPKVPTGSQAQPDLLLLPERFVARAAAAPDIIAIAHQANNTEQISYGELERRSRQLATRLQGDGVGVDVPVGLSLKRSPEMVVAMLGVIRAGGAVVPLDPAYPRKRLDFMVRDAGIHQIVRDNSVGEELAPSRSVEARPEREELAPPLRSGLIYVIYTSGSTGRPKGVAMSHAAMANLMDWQLTKDLPHPARTLQFAPISFDVSFQEIFSTLGQGGTLVLVSEEIRREPMALWRYLETERVERIFLPYVALQQLAESTHEAKPPLKEIITAGEKLRITPTIRDFFQRLPSTRLHNHYGPSETHVATAFRLPVDPCSWPIEPAIGPPLTGGETYVLGRGLEPLPTNVPGELYVGGLLPARGYLGQSASTAERFVPHSLTARRGERLYRTGDLAAWRPDGQLYFLGRVDHQVKIRGYRVEPGEIETAILGLEGVRNAAVVHHEEGPASRLVAYVVGSPNTSALRSSLTLRLPDYLVPSAFVILDQLPLLPSGKVDRGALLGLEPLKRPASDQASKPRTPSEEQVALLMGQTLDIRDLDRDDHFFHLGGHSLLATRLISALRQRCHVELPVRAVFEAPTVQDLATRVDQARREGENAPPPIVSIARSKDRSPQSFPQSFAQQRLDFINRLQPGPLYNMPAALRLEGKIRGDTLHACLRQIMGRHETLRTALRQEKSQSVQVISNTGDTPLPLKQIDLLGLPSQYRNEEAQHLAHEDARRPFELAVAPLWRATLVRLEPDRHHLLINLHHSICDGWSLGLLVREVACLYATKNLLSKSNPLPELPIQYADFTVWQRQWLAQGTPAFERQLKYWNLQLREPPVLDLVTDRPRPAVRGFRGASLAFHLPPALTDALKDRGQSVGATLFMVLSAGFFALLERYTGQRDLTMGTPVAGRNQAQTEALIGLFVNTLVLRADLSRGDLSMTELLIQSRETALQAYAHQDLPFERLVEELEVDRNLSRTPLFQVMLVLQNVAIPDLELPDLLISQLPVGNGTSKVDLTLTFWETELLEGWAEYDTALFDATTIQRLIGHFERLLGAAVQHPDRPLVELDLLSSVERHMLIRATSPPAHPATSQDDPEDLIDLFELQVQKSKDAIAVVGKATSSADHLTYRELNHRAETLARHLIRLGVGTDVTVGICLERSSQMMATVLGVWKAGGAILPLDPTYPAERLAFMLRDAKAPILITTRPHAGRHKADLCHIFYLDDGRREPSPGLGKSPLAPLFQRGGQRPFGPSARTSSDRLFYIVYTSGSTGHPKGIGMPARGPANLLHWHQNHQQPGLRTLQFSALSFDACFHELFAAWSTGGTLVLVPEDLRRDMPGLARFLDQQKIGGAIFPVVVLHQLAKAWERDRAIPSGLVEIGATAEQFQISPALVQVFERSAPGRISLSNQYGPSEVLVATVAHFGGPAHRWPRQAPIGRAITRTEAYVLNEDLRLAPRGVPGELAFGGIGLARGYLKRPGRTAASFVPHPFGQGGRRLYKSGDLGRLLADGQIEFLGRLDHQLKIRGFRVEPGEVESALTDLPKVREAVVVATDSDRHRSSSDRRLVAFVVSHARTEGQADAPTTRQLRHRLAETLPDHMVPSSFVILDQLPLLPSGKVDRGALLSHSLSTQEPATTMALPRTATEKRVAILMGEILGRQNLGWNDHFFHQGGHSLLATRLISALRETYRVELPIRIVFEAPTVEDLASRVDQARTEKGETNRDETLPPIVRTARPAGRGMAPSFAQERLWFIDQLQPGPLYNIPAALRLDGRLQIHILHACLKKIARRHETLRTVLRREAGHLVQVINDANDANVQLPLIDLSRLPGHSREEEARQLGQGDARRPFHLAAGPLWRASLVMLKPSHHQLLLNFHHSICDGWSMGLWMQEVASLYAVRPLPELPIQYADFTVWQREWLTDGTPAFERQLKYWTDQLRQPPVLDLATDQPRPAVRRSKGASLPFRLSAEQTKNLQHWSQSQGATLFMALTASFSALLHHYTGQRDLTVGTPVAGRNHAQTEALIGLFVNTLVLRADLSRPDLSMTDLLVQTRETALQAYAHQDLPFEKLVEELEGERNLSRTPLFQVMLVLQNTFGPDMADIADIELPELSISPLPVNTGTSKLDLTFTLRETQEGYLEAWAEYDTGLFDITTIHRLTQHFTGLIHVAVQSPDQPLARLNLLSQAERQMLILETSWGDGPGTEQNVSDDLIELFEFQVRKTTNAIAVVDHSTSSAEHQTYRELNQRADLLAQHLRQLGVGTDVVVGICLDRSQQMMAAILGVWKAGGAILPLDPAYPPERLTFMLQDAGAPILITTRRHAGLVEARGPMTDLRHVYLEGGAKEPSPGLGKSPLTPLFQRGEQRPYGPLARCSLDRLFYIAYTSGSTGRPKGIGMPARGPANLLHWHRRYQQPGLRTLQFSPLSFDACFHEIFAAWSTGGTLVLVPETWRRDVHQLVQFLDRHKIAGAIFPVVVLHQLAEAWERDQTAPSSLVEVGATAEQLQVTKAMVRVFERLASSAGLTNQYGPSEVLVATVAFFNGPSSIWPRQAPIGRAISRTEAYVLTPDLQPTPRGVPGELAFAGVGLARGYLGRPGRTAASFIPHPFIFDAGPECGGQRLYKSGDRGRLLADGQIEFLGRLDQQLKIRGFRVEPGEIENALTDLPGVRQAVVVATDDGQSGSSSDRRLVAYVVSPTANARELRDRLAQRLPNHMVPRAFVFLDQIPLTSTDKRDLRRLPPPDETQAASSEKITPNGPIEELLAGVWADLLGVTVGADDNFFESGGHSLLATRLVTRIREAFQVELSIESVFLAPTIRELARRIEEVIKGDDETSTAVLPTIEPADRGASPPLSFSQQRLWFLDQLTPASPMYNMPSAIRLVGQLSPLALKTSLQLVVRRHEALRTTLIRDAGEARQEIGSGQARALVDLPLADLDPLPDAARAGEIRRLTRSEARQPFDLARGPLLRLTLLRESDRQHVLLLNLHHVICDGWSIGVLVREIGALYPTVLSQDPSDQTQLDPIGVLPELPIQYADFAVWQRQWLAGSALEKELTYWRANLADLSPLELPTDRPRPRTRNGLGAAFPFTLGANLMDRLRTWGGQRGATLYMTLLAAFQVLLHRYSHQFDITVGSPVAGRRHAETENLIGLFVNTLVLRTRKLSPDRGFGHLLHQVRRSTLEAFAHQDVPFEKLVEELRPPRNPSRMPLFDVMFTWQNTPFEPLALEHLHIEPLPLEVETTRFDLSLSLADSNPLADAEANFMDGFVTYSRDLFDAVTVRRLTRHFATLLEALVEDPDRSLAALPLLGASARHQLLQEWNAAAVTPEPVTPEATEEIYVHAMFSAQAARTPDAIAVVDLTADQDGAITVLSYAKLDAWSHHQAVDLRLAGVGPDVPVGVGIERSTEAVIALLGILKAGGSYLPIDPDLPDKRAAFMEEDASTLTRGTQRGDLTPESAAYVLYTSGSTGHPKGVVISHRALAHHTRWYQDTFTLGPDDALLHKTPAAFDVAIGELLSPLVAGARLVLARPGGHRDADYLTREIARHRVTVVHGVPSLVRLLIHSPGFDDCRCLRLLCCGGEALSTELVALIRERFNGEIANLYGPTEAAIRTLFWTSRQGIEAQTPTVPIGHPIHGVRAILLDTALEPMPIGVHGELCLTGPSLGRGYLNQPARTATSFVPNSFTTTYDERVAHRQRLYKTGDLVRQLVDGQFEFLGRLDHQVKVRGFRVELGEIEAALNARTDVRGAVVVHDPKASRLIAYLVPTGEPIPVDLLRRDLEARLPSYMVPSVFVDLLHFPLLPSGKLNRVALPAPTGERPDLGRVYQAPRSKIEQFVVGVWRDVLGLDQVGLEDAFFDLGGHSLQLIEVRSRLEAHFHVNLPLVELFNRSTVQTLAEYLTEMTGKASRKELDVIRDVDQRQRQLGAGKDRRQKRLRKRRELGDKSEA